ncbi:hypothetical protein ACI2OX_05030 [Bacillus sp. N9]
MIETTDSAIDEATQVIQRVRELTVQASNETYDEGQLQSIAREISQLKEHLKTIANAKVGDKYIFNGTNTLKAPFENVNDALPIFDTDDFTFELAKGFSFLLIYKGPLFSVSQMEIMFSPCLISLRQH